MQLENRPRRLTTRSPKAKAIRALTLAELLVTLSMLALLTAITLGVVEASYERAYRARVKIELAALARALEEYKAYYGDYPWVDSATSIDGSRELYAALAGMRAPDGSAIISEVKPFVELSKFTFEGNAFKDPWDANYIYKYKDINDREAWDRFGYMLMSKGPDGEDVTIGADGFFPAIYLKGASARDDIIAGEQS